MIENPLDLVILTHHGDWTLTKARTVDDYAVWQGQKLIAVGGFALMQKVFTDRKGTKMSGAPGGSPNIEQRVAQYLKLRDAIKAQDDAHKEKMAPYRETLEKLNNLLLDHLNKVGVESARTDAGTVYKTVKKSVSLEDADQFMRHVIGTENWGLIDRKASATGCEEFLKENGVLPPGVKWTTTAVVGVRKA
jgi:hypothetical protein